MPRVKTTGRNLLEIEGERILFDPGKMLLSETIAAEEAARMSWPQIIAGLNVGAMGATRAVVWILRKRHNPRLRLTDVEFTFEDYELLDPDIDPDYWVLADADDPDAIDVDEYGAELEPGADPAVEPGKSDTDTTPPNPEA